MPADTRTAVATPAGPTEQETRTAELTRTNTILALCEENGIGLKKSMELVARGISAGEAGIEILRLQRAEGAGRPSPVIGEVIDRAADNPFTDRGEFIRAVILAGRGLPPDTRLTRTASGLQDSVGSDGGFLVPPQMATELLERAFGPDGGQVLQRVRQIPITVGNGTKINGIDETSRANGLRFGGISMAFVGEGDTIAASKPKFRQIELNVKKCVGAVYLTEENLEDVPQMVSIVDQAFSDEIVFVLEDNVFNGTGVGAPLGILNSPGIVTQAAVSGQTAATINVANVTGMYARFVGNRPRAAWFIDASVWPQLMQLVLGQQPVFLPQGTLNAGPFPLLLGLPVIETEYQAAVGTPGDIVLADMGFYIMARKGGVRTAQSMHVRFLNDEQVLKFVIRVDGQPGVHSPITPKNLGATKSPFVVLASR